MKKIIKNPIFTFALGAILFGGIGVVSAYSVFAKDISYIPNASTWNVNNVEDAINDLYLKTNKEILNNFTLKMRTTSTSTGAAVTNYMVFNTKLRENYDYFIIDKVVCNSYVNKDASVTYGDNHGTYLILEENKEYSFEDYTNIWTVVHSNSNNQEAYCDVSIKFYNK